MKYYHLVGVSAGLFVLQFTLENILWMETSSLIKKWFLGGQSVLLVSYMILLLLHLRKKKRAEKVPEQKIVLVKIQITEKADRSLMKTN